MLLYVSGERVRVNRLREGRACCCVRGMDRGNVNTLQQMGQTDPKEGAEYCDMRARILSTLKITLCHAAHKVTFVIEPTFVSMLLTQITCAHQLRPGLWLWMQKMSPLTRTNQAGFRSLSTFCRLWLTWDIKDEMIQETDEGAGVGGKFRA